MPFKDSILTLNSSYTQSLNWELVFRLVAKELDILEKVFHFKKVISNLKLQHLRLHNKYDNNILLTFSNLTAKQYL